MAHHQEVQLYVYNNWYLLFFLDDCVLSWLDGSNQDNRQYLDMQHRNYTGNVLYPRKIWSIQSITQLFFHAIIYLHFYLDYMFQPIF